MLTDGIFEAAAEDDTMFGMERTLQVVRENRHRRASEIIDSLHQAVRSFSAGQKVFDDVTAMVIKVE
jgi:serine phosphatase RsbU (regulator of sigma subunit)